MPGVSVRIKWLNRVFCLQWITAVTAQRHGGCAQYFVSVLLLCRQRRNNSAFKHKLCSLDVAQLNPVGFSPQNRKKHRVFPACAHLRVREG